MKAAAPLYHLLAQVSEQKAETTNFQSHTVLQLIFSYQKRYHPHLINLELYYIE